MRISKALFTCTAAALLFGTSSNGFGHVIYFSTTGPPSPIGTGGKYVSPGLVENTAPEITLNLGDTVDLHVWVNVDNTPLNSKLNTVAIDVRTTHPGVAAANGFEVFDAHNLTLGTTRWQHDAALADPNLEICGIDPFLDVHNCFGFGPPNGIFIDAINPAPGLMVQNAVGLGVTSDRIGQSTTAFDFEDGHDDPTGSFYFGTLRLTATAPGRAGLYFAVGRTKITVNGATTHPVQFGNNTTDTYSGAVVGAGDPLDPVNFLKADAIINVLPPPVTRNILQMTNDPDTPDLPPVPGVHPSVPVNIPVGSPRGTLVVENWVDSFFDVFVDVELPPIGGPTMSELLAMLQQQSMDGEDADYMLTPLLDTDNELGLGVDYDFRVTMPRKPGAQILDFDFGPTGVVVANLGIPEPSSVVLSALGALGLAAYGWRRRKA